MNFKIENIFIEKLFDKNNIDWNLKDVNVLVGKNGSGKTTILQLINAALLNTTQNNALGLCNTVNLHFDKERTEENRVTLVNPSALKRHAKNIFLTQKDFLNNIVDNLITEAINKNNNSINKDKIKNLKSDVISTFLTDLEKDENITNYFSEKNKNKHPQLTVEYISTINMSANSINNITKSDGKNTNFLDYEIREELNTLLKSNNSRNKNKLINVLNIMFSDSNKTVKIKDDLLIFQLDDGKEIGYESLSSGERQVIYIFIKVIKAEINKSLILMDEPEISLHLSWQEKLLTQIREVNKSSQIIIVTHSPAIVMNGWMDSFVDIKDIMIEADNNV